MRRDFGWTAAAAAARSLRVGALVFDNDFRRSAMLAKEAATLDVLYGGGLDLILAGLEGRLANAKAEQLRGDGIA